MALSSQDFQDLKLSIDDLTRAERDLTAAILRQTPGAGAAAGGGGSGAATPPPPAGAAARAATPTGIAGFTGPDSKADSAPGFGLSSVRQLAGAGGLGGVSSLAAGLAGGPVGLASAGIGLAAQEISSSLRRDRAAGQSAKGAFQNAPLDETDTMVAYRTAKAAKLSQLESDDEVEDSFKGRISMSKEERGQRAVDRAGLRRQILQEQEDFLSPKQRALALTKRVFENYARNGGMRQGPEGDAGRKAADEFFKTALAREEGAQDVQKWARIADRRMTSTAPGAQGGLGAGQ